MNTRIIRLLFGTAAALAIAFVLFALPIITSARAAAAPTSFFVITVSALAVDRSKLYVGGFFTTAGGTSAPYIAQYLMQLLNLPLILK